ncbi:LOW QUALITY PROTEIN: hypothetical protein PHPALM_28541 [Phytophthora palmivora]|uniref:Uncharacterized protein n=1 Tax=Phytophthora palmivora TaxID=4796 RepID=A0A2P4X9U2_9STRA|nr:LOW QUALITY PROTEIN: hypothetical protein PHPALM_28541 [Phytophthora palmivora]
MEKQTELIHELRIYWKDRKWTRRILAVLAGSLKYGAAQWYIVKKDDVKSVEDVFEKLEEGFVPPYLQECLRDQMNDLKERQCTDLPDYISRVRHLITQVKEMSEMDKIMYFLRGLPSTIRKETQYRGSTTSTDAITRSIMIGLTRIEDAQMEHATDQSTDRMTTDDRRVVPMDLCRWTCADGDRQREGAIQNVSPETYVSGVVVLLIGPGTVLSSQCRKQDVARRSKTARVMRKEGVKRK